MDTLKLPERFVSHGIVGRGSQATVWLVTDRLRNERLALKVLHPHRVADPAVRSRLLREVKAATLVRSDAALLPYDVHEFDGQLALSMPFHPGRTVADRIAQDGAMPPADVRALGGRLARALAAAHAAGVLHRDVSANNVLVGDDVSGAVLTDFGSARLSATTGSRSAFAGTLGYAAPEVLAGRRGDARADLYGLGAVLYLAATGRPVWDEQGGLAAQLAGKFTPIRQVVPTFPEDLANLIERLLQVEPAARPAGAAEVADQLAGHRAVAAPSAEAGAAGALQFLPAGRFSVEVEEVDGDRGRRQKLRRKARGEHAPRAAEELERWGRHLAGRVRDQLGIPAPDPRSPEERLVRAVAAEAQVPPEVLRQSPVLLKRRFRLVEAVDRACALRLAEAAAAAGFRAKVVERPRAAGWGQEWIPGLLWSLVVAAWLWVGLAGGDLLAAVVLTVATAVFARRVVHVAPQGDATPPAYEVDLAGMLAGPATPRFPRLPEAGPRALPRVEAPLPVASHGAQLLSGATAALDALGAEVEAGDRLPEPFRDDLRARLRELRAEASALAADIDRLERELSGHGAGAHEVERVTGRLERLRALGRSGERVDAAELDALERAVREHLADEEAAAVLESRLAASTAHLLEIASTASRIRRELLAEGGVDARATAELSRQVEAMRRARRETA